MCVFAHVPAHMRTYKYVVYKCMCMIRMLFTTCKQLHGQGWTGNIIQAFMFFGGKSLVYTVQAFERSSVTSTEEAGC